MLFVTGNVNHAIASFVAEVTCFATSVRQSVQSRSLYKWVPFSVQHAAGDLLPVVVSLSTIAIRYPWVLSQPDLHQPAPLHCVLLIALIVSVVSSWQLVSGVITAIVVFAHHWTDQPFLSLVLLASQVSSCSGFSPAKVQTVTFSSPCPMYLQ